MMDRKLHESTHIRKNHRCFQQLLPPQAAASGAEHKISKGIMYATIEIKAAAYSISSKP